MDFSGDRYRSDGRSLLGDYFQDPRSSPHAIRQSGIKFVNT